MFKIEYKYFRCSNGLYCLTVYRRLSVIQLNLRRLAKTCTRSSVFSLFLFHFSKRSNGVLLRIRIASFVQMMLNIGKVPCWIGFSLNINDDEERERKKKEEVKKIARNFIANRMKCRHRILFFIFLYQHFFCVRSNLNDRNTAKYYCETGTKNFSDSP